MSGMVVGEYVGSMIAVALFGAFLAWITRKLFKIGLTPSYVIGVIVAALVLIGGMVSANPQVPPGVFGLRYISMAPLAFLVLWLTARRKRRAE